MQGWSESGASRSTQQLSIGTIFHNGVKTRVGLGPVARLVFPIAPLIWTIESHHSVRNLLCVVAAHWTTSVATAKTRMIKLISS